MIVFIHIHPNLGRYVWFYHTYKQVTCNAMTDTNTNINDN